MTLSPYARIALWSCGISVLMIAPFYLLFSWGIVDFTDLTFYGVTTVLFDQQFLHGELYPRWLMDANAGLGAVTYFYYAPVAAYLSLPLAFLSNIDPDGILRVILGMGIATAISGVTCFVWLSGRFEEKAAFIGALIYVCIPFRLHYLYIDFNLSQCWALAWFPLILWQLDRLMRCGRYAIPGLSAAIALLMFTHLPSCIVFLPVLPVILVLSVPLRQIPVFLLKLLLCFAIAGGLASIYLLPVALNQNAVDVKDQMSGKYNYAVNFWHIGIRPTVMALTAFAAWLLWAMKKGERRQLTVWYVLLFGALFMMTPPSLPIWNALPPLQVLQFPFIRFYAPLFPVLAVLGTYAVTRCRFGPVGYMFVFLFAVVHIYYVHYIDADVRNWPEPRTPDIARMMQGIHDTHMIVGEQYFRPVKAPASMFYLPSMQQWQERTDQAEFVTGEGSITVQDWEPRRVALRMHVTSAEAVLLLHRLYFPGWSAQKDGVAVPLKASSYSGLITTTLPHGDYTLIFALDHVPGERMGKMISYLSLLLILFWLWAECRKARTQPSVFIPKEEA